MKCKLPDECLYTLLKNLQVVNAILCVAEHGCKWRALPSRFGNWHPVYTRMNRWAKSGVMDRVFERLQAEQIVRIKIKAFYKKRHEVERLFSRLKALRRIFSRFEKLDVVFLAFIHFVLIVDALRLC